MGMENLFERFVQATEPDDRKLYLTSVGYSVFHLALMWYAYVTHGHAPPYAFVIVHMVFVGVLYALPKEILRWQNGSKPPTTKAGHLLVLLWFFSFLLMGLGQHGYADWGYGLPDGMTEMTCFLLATLGLTHTSKKKHALQHPPCPQAEAPAAEPPPVPKTENPPT